MAHKVNPVRSDSLSEAKHLLRRLLLENGEQLATAHRWVSEHERWTELVFAFLVAVSKVPERQLRAAVQELDALELLSVPELARITTDAGKPQPVAQNILDVLVDAGMKRTEAKRALTAIAETAGAIQRICGGKLQVWLRRHGEAMAASFERDVTLTGLSKPETRFAVTYWLQNVLGMPLTLHDESVARFLTKHRLSLDAVIAAADALDVNVAAVDDLIQTAQSAEKDNKRG